MGEGAVGVSLANVDVTHVCRIVCLHSSSDRRRIVVGGVRVNTICAAVHVFALNGHVRRRKSPMMRVNTLSSSHPCSKYTISVIPTELGNLCMGRVRLGEPRLGFAERVSAVP
jgi:hypothetical protein